MTRLICNKIFHYNVLINASVSAILTLLMWYTGKFLEGALHDIAYILFLPSFQIISLFRGVNVAMHFTRYRTYLLVSFVFYSFAVGLIQVIFLILLKMIRNRARILNSNVH
jgi:hypothetical protein